MRPLRQLPSLLSPPYPPQSEGGVNIAALPRQRQQASAPAPLRCAPCANRPQLLLRFAALAGALGGTAAATIKLSPIPACPPRPVHRAPGYAGSPEKPDRTATRCTPAQASCQTIRLFGTPLESAGVTAIQGQIASCRSPHPRPGFACYGPGAGGVGVGGLVLYDLVFLFPFGVFRPSDSRQPMLPGVARIRSMRSRRLALSA